MKKYILMVASLLIFACGVEEPGENFENNLYDFPPALSVNVFKFSSGYVVLDCGCHEEVPDDIHEFPQCASGFVEKFLCNFECAYYGRAWGVICE